jgi:lysophospholipase L1-like esterase
MEKMFFTTVAAMLTMFTINAEPAIWLIGDSTVCDYSANRHPMMGWGQGLKKFCKPGVKINNRAVGGRSTKSFIDEKRWDKVMAGLQKGDFVFIQFGHNDQKKKQEVLYTDPNGSYKDYLKKYIADARSKGAEPILVTSVARRIIKDGKIVNSLGKYPDAMKDVAKETNTPLIDLNSISLQEFNKLGGEGTRNVFLHLKPGESPNYPKGSKDNSHFSEKGAELIAGWIVADAKKQNLKIAELFIPVP